MSSRFFWPLYWLLEYVLQQVRSIQQEQGPDRRRESEAILPIPHWEGETIILFYFIFVSPTLTLIFIQSS